MPQIVKIAGAYQLPNAVNRLSNSQKFEYI